LIERGRVFAPLLPSEASGESVYLGWADASGVVNATNAAEAIPAISTCFILLRSAILSVWQQETRGQGDPQQLGPHDDCGKCFYDSDGDCSVSILDLLILLGNWG